jgi:hypothetical protein
MKRLVPGACYSGGVVQPKVGLPKYRLWGRRREVVLLERQLAVLLGLSMTLVVLALSACGGGGGGGEQNQEGSRPRPLPENLQALRPGEYRSEEFKPSLSFRVGEGWTNDLEISDASSITRGEDAALGFLNVQEVYKPGSTTLEVVEAPKDLVGWFQQHPYLQTDKPEPITVGGIKGVELDVVVEDLPEDYFGACGSDCVDLFKSSDRSWWAFVEEWKERVIILEDVEGETVTIDFGSPAAEFDEFAPKAEKVIDSVEWKGA